MSASQVESVTKRISKSAYQKAERKSQLESLNATVSALDKEPVLYIGAEPPSCIITEASSSDQQKTGTRQRRIINYSTLRRLVVTYYTIDDASGVIRSGTAIYRHPGGNHLISTDGKFASYRQITLQLRHTAIQRYINRPLIVVGKTDQFTREKIHKRIRNAMQNSKKPTHKETYGDQEVDATHVSSQFGGGFSFIQHNRA